MTHVWLVGTYEGTDAADIPAWAIDAFGGASFHRFRSPKTAAEWDGDPADVVVVIQHRPREFAASHIAALIASQPLAQFLVGLGAWCASSARSEAAWPESITVPVWDLRSSLRRTALTLEQGDVLAPWQTSSRDEVLLSECKWIGRLDDREGETPAEPHQRRAAEATLAAQRELRPPAGHPQFEPTVEIIVESPDRVLAESLRDIVGEFTVTEQTTFIRSITLWDVDPLPNRLSGLTERRRRGSADRIIALVDQPTRATVKQLTRAGADAVVAKPFRAAELWDAIDRFTTPPANGSAESSG